MDLAGAPTMRAGNFTVPFRLSQASKDRIAGRRVGIAIRVGHRWVNLIEPKSVDLTGDRFIVSARFEGVDDGEFKILSVLRVVLR